MSVPHMTVKVAIPAPVWRRWSEIHQGEEGDISTLLVQLLETYLDAEEQRRSHLVGFDWQI